MPFTLAILQMMTNPITPPPELVQEWWDKVPGTFTSLADETHLATQAAQWGADQELEACVEWLDRNSPAIGGFHLRIDRRPKPPNLKEQALAAVAELEGFKGVDTIRRALEQLPN